MNLKVQVESALVPFQLKCVMIGRQGQKFLMAPEVTNGAIEKARSRSRAKLRGLTADAGWSLGIKGASNSRLIIIVAIAIRSPQ